MIKQEAAYNQVSVISPKFCLGHSLDLFITKSIWQGNFVVTNNFNGKIMFEIEGSMFSFNRKRVMFDASAVPILTLRKKVFSVSTTWQVFRGEGKDEKDLIFSVRRSSIFQIKTNLVVFMAKNKSEDVCNYRMQGSWFGRYSCQVYVGDSSTTLAQMHKNLSLNTLFRGKDGFKVKVYKNVDCAFIVALAIILHEIDSQMKHSSKFKTYR